MSTLALSLALYTPRKPNTSFSSSTCCWFLKNDSKRAIRVPMLVEANYNNYNENEKEKMNYLMGRRDAILAFTSTAGILGGVLQSQLALASESEESKSTCEFTVSPSGLAFCDKLVGLGPQPEAGQLIKAHYVGKLENGKIFDSSYGRGKPLTFRVGVGEVIKGWDQGILGTEGVPPMLAGGKRTLRIPPELGYGMRGAGCRGGTCIIPPESVLYFDVEFIGKA